MFNSSIYNASYSCNGSKNNDNHKADGSFFHGCTRWSYHQPPYLRLVVFCLKETAREHQIEARRIL